MTEPSACLATLPVSTISSLFPSLIDSFKYFFVCISNRDGTAEHTVKLYRPDLTLSLIVTFGSSSYANSYCCHVQPFLRGPLREDPCFRWPEEAGLLATKSQSLDHLVIL